MGGSILRFAAPIVGAAVGGPIGAAIGGGIAGASGGGGLSGALKGAALGGVTGYAPQIGGFVNSSLGNVLGSYATKGALSGLGGALGGGVVGAFGKGGGLSGALKGAATGGVSGYLANGGLSQIGDSIGISNPFGSSATPASATSATGAATSGSNSIGSINSSLGKGVGGSYAGGGSTGGLFRGLSTSPSIGDTSTGEFADAFFGRGGGTVGDSIASSFNNSGGSLIDTALGGLTDAITPSQSFLDNPISYLGNKAVDKITNIDSGDLLGGGLKAGLSYGLAGDNAQGFRDLQAAAEQQQQLYQPFYLGGLAANRQLSDLYGTNGGVAQDAAFAQFREDPGYQFARQQGIDALDASAARRGLLLSGTNQQAVQNYATDLANQTFQQYLDRLRQQQQLGLTGASGVGQAGIDAATASAALGANRANLRNNIIGQFLV